MRIEKQGRGGKTVTVISGFTREKRLMANLASELKRHLGTGGTFTDGAIGLQGDVRERARVCLERMGFEVKGKPFSSPAVPKKPGR